MCRTLFACGFFLFLTFNRKLQDLGCLFLAGNSDTVVGLSLPTMHSVSISHASFVLWTVPGVQIVLCSLRLWPIEKLRITLLWSSEAMDFCSVICITNSYARYLTLWVYFPFLVYIISTFLRLCILDFLVYSFSLHANYEILLLWENATADLSCQSLCVLFYFLQLGNFLVVVTCQNFQPLFYFVQQYFS